MPRVHRPRTLSRLLLACAASAWLAVGCGGHDDARSKPKPPPIPTGTPTASVTTPTVTAEPTASVAPTTDPPVPTAPADPFAPPGAEIAQAIAAIAPDPPPPKLASNTHYMISNEDRPQVFRDVVKDRGGVYVGVGSEQNWLIGA